MTDARIVATTGVTGARTAATAAADREAPMTQRSVAGQVTRALSDATGRSEDELRLAASAALVVGGLFAALRLLEWLVDLGSNVLGSSRTRP